MFGHVYKSPVLWGISVWLYLVVLIMFTCISCNLFYGSAWCSVYVHAASFLWQHPKVGFVHLLLWVEKWTQQGWRMCFWIPSSWTGILYGNVQACPWVGKQGPITAGATYSPPTLSVRWIPSTSGSCASPMLPPVCLLTAITCCFLGFVSVHFPFPIVAWAP